MHSHKLFELYYIPPTTKNDLWASISVFILKSLRNSFMLKHRGKKKPIIRITFSLEVISADRRVQLSEAKSKFNQVAQRLVQLRFKDTLGWSCGSPVYRQPAFPERCTTDTFSTCCLRGSPNPFLKALQPVIPQLLQVHNVRCCTCVQLCEVHNVKKKQYW